MNDPVQFQACGVASTQTRVVDDAWLLDASPAAGSGIDVPLSTEDTNHLAYDRAAYAQLLGKDSFAWMLVARVQGVGAATIRDWI